MQVKKFEARTMKEALEMVKRQLGPEAIILGARDNRKSFGLVGEGSVEITAAVSDEVLAKKKLTESKMVPEKRERFQNSSAKIQKQVMDKFVAAYEKENQPPRPATRTRYIDIDDDADQPAAQNSANPHQAQERIKSAAQRAWTAMHSHAELIEDVEDDWAVKRMPAPQARSVADQQKSAEISALKSELAGLKSALTQFQKVPQTLAGSHPGAAYGLSYEFSATYEKLTGAGLLPEIAAEILLAAQAEMPPIRHKNRALVDAWTARHIMDSTLIADEGGAKKIQLFIGPSGSGKTATMIKMAAHAAVHEKKRVVLLTADTYKVGAVDQMRIYAQILNVPFAIVRSQGDWSYLSEQLRNYDLIFCDFPGMSLKSLDEIQKIRSLMPIDTSQVGVHLVLSAMAKNEDLFEIGKRFKVTQFNDVIFTGLDESVLHGSIYNFSKQFQVPLHSFGLGPRVPEDFELATRERVLDLIFKITKMKKAEVFG